MCTHEPPNPGQPLVLFDVDTQVDFMNPEGKLYVPGAERIVPNIERLVHWARANHVLVVSTADAHAPDDPEFRTWPPHCVAGTPGQQRIPATRFAEALVVPCRAGAFQAPTPSSGQLIVEKTTYSPEDNPNWTAILDSLAGRRAVVFGVATEFCVRASVLALRRRAFPVDLVSDAIQAITLEGGRKAIEEMTRAGTRVVSTDEVCGAAHD
jgi:nicotinamidase/pyrazinamidase